MPVFSVTDCGATPGASALQTAYIQSALDRCRVSGGTVEIPEGIYRVSGLRMWSRTTLHLLENAVLLGSDDCADYAVFPMPEGMENRNDQEMLRGDYDSTPRAEYRRAIVTAYGERDISIIGEKGAVIDGADCWDGEGEEGFRGPHAVYLSHCENVTLRGYTVKNAGNFAHQLDACAHIDMRRVRALGGHDAIHMHCCTDILIEECVFHTGDDCVAGADVRSFTMRGCDINTSCNCMRIGGVDFLIENCVFRGPGIYPHRLTTVRSRNDVLPQNAGRHNTLYCIEYFSSTLHPAAEPAGRWLMRDCVVDGVDRFLHYEQGSRPCLHAGAPFTGLTLRNVTVTGLAGASVVRCDDKHPVRVVCENVTAAARDGAHIAGLFDPATPNLLLG